MTWVTNGQVWRRMSDNILHKVSRRDDLDTAKRIQDEQVAVACDQIISITADRKLKKFIVVGIATSTDRLSDSDQFCDLDEFADKTATLRVRRISIKFSAVEGVIQFFKDIDGHNNGPPFEQKI